MQKIKGIGLNWTDVLKQIGWPIETLVLDFETYFDQDYSLSKISTVEYITDSRFEFTGLGFEILNHPKANGPIFIPAPAVPWVIERLKILFGKAFHNCTVVAKNCKFDILILLEKFGIHPPFIIDIEDLSRFYDARMSHKLKDVAPMFNLETKGDTKQFKGQHWEDMDHQAMKEYNLGDIRNETALLQILLPIISNPEIEIRLACHTLGMYLNPHFILDYILAGELISKMGQQLYKTITKSDHTKEEISGTLSFTELLINAIPTHTIPVKPGKPGKNMIKLLGQPGVVPQLAKTDEGVKQLLNHPDENVRNLMEAKVAIKSWPGHIKRIEKMIKSAKCSNDLLRIYLKYYGAHTGRWSGGGGWNPQNFGGRGRGAEIHPLIRKMRNMLIAPEDKILAITDSAQIEARILAWIAGQIDLTEGFRNGEDIYSVFATRLFGEKVWKPKADEQTKAAKTAKVRRGFGKDAILGCGYGMGANTFFDRCRENDDLRPLFDSGEYDWDFINGLIKTYRNTYKKIPKFWTRIEKAFKWVIKYPKETVEIFIPDITCYGKHGQNCTCNSCIQDIMADCLPPLKPRILFRFWKSGNMVHLQLPSGRVLFYRQAHLDKKGTIRHLCHEHGKPYIGTLWGGAITENVVQAIARDLLGYWILECEQKIGPVVLHSHDEIVCMVDDSVSANRLSEMIDIFSTGPDWAKGLPLAAEGQLTEKYVK